MRCHRYSDNSIFDQMLMMLVQRETNKRFVGVRGGGFKSFYDKLTFLLTLKGERLQVHIISLLANVYLPIILYTYLFCYDLTNQIALLALSVSVLPLT